jgi:hypothetical protein
MLSSFIAATAFCSNVYETGVRRGEPSKSPLSKKAKKVRAKNKIAKQTRKNNRKK